MPGGYIYLASPYSKHPKGPNAAYRDACKAAGTFIKAGIMVYSPIAHCHGIAKRYPMLGTDHRAWRAHNETMLALADSLCVACFEGWQSSVGISDERAFAHYNVIPILFWDPTTPPPGSFLPPAKETPREVVFLRQQ